MSESGIKRPLVPAPVSTAEPEKRRELRAPLRVLKVQAELKGEVFFGYATNISKSGLCILSTNPRATGTKVRVAFQLASNLPKIDCQAEVVWSRNYGGDHAPQPGMGLRFLDLSSETIALIEKFIDDERNTSGN